MPDISKVQGNLRSERCPRSLNPTFLQMPHRGKGAIRPIAIDAVVSGFFGRG